MDFQYVRNSMAGGKTEKSLEQTPTWAVAAVCIVFVICFLLVERGLFCFGRYLKRNKQKELYHMLEVIQGERVNRYVLPCEYKPPEAPPPKAESPVACRRLQAQGESESTAKCSPCWERRTNTQVAILCGSAPITAARKKLELAGISTATFTASSGDLGDPSTDMTTCASAYASLLSTSSRPPLTSIRRTMEEDFKVVVGISWYLWAFVCL